jgi:hypothetical protein
MRLPCRRSLRGCFAVATVADAPVDDFGFVNLELSVARIQAGPLADGAIDVFGPAAGATDDVVVVVTNPRVEAHRRTRRLDAAHEVVFAQDPQRVVDRLSGNGAKFGPHGRGDFVGCAVGVLHRRLQYTDALRRHVEAYLAEAIGMGLLHGGVD